MVRSRKRGGRAVAPGKEGRLAAACSGKKGGHATALAEEGRRSAARSGEQGGHADPTQPRSLDTGEWQGQALVSRRGCGGGAPVG